MVVFDDVSNEGIRGGGQPVRATSAPPGSKTFTGERELVAHEVPAPPGQRLV